MTTITYKIPSIHCMHCVHTIQMELSELPGVKSVNVNAMDKKAEISFEAPATEQQIRELLKDINYPVAE
jgi:copper chaperone